MPPKQNLRDKFKSRGEKELIVKPAATLLQAIATKKYVSKDLFEGLLLSADKQTCTLFS